MPLVEIKGFNALIENNPYLINPQIINKKHMKSLSKCQEMITIKQEPNQIICIIEKSKNSLEQTYQDK